MVEITYQMILSTIQTIALVVGIIYYLTIMRSNQKNQQMQLEARKLDLFMKWHIELTKPEIMQNFTEVMFLEWDDFEDFQKKYDHSHNPESAGKRFATWYYWSGQGYLLSQGMIDADTIYELEGSAVVGRWKRFKPIIEAYRIKDNRVDTWKWFEYLANEIEKVRERRGLPEYDIPEKVTPQLKHNR